MNFRITGIIVRREYLNKVQKKSFLVTTFVVPVLMAALCIVPVVVMMNSKDKAKKIAVVDESGIVMPALQSTETLEFVDYGDFPVDSVKPRMKELGLAAVLSIKAHTDSVTNFSALIVSLKPLGIEAAGVIEGKINDAVQDYRIASYNIPELGKIMTDVRQRVEVSSYTIDEDGKETISETGVYTILSMLFGIIIFLFITLFGGMVMSAVIEEKSSRVVEVLVSSVKATELMFGKIIGIALVALTQFLLWIVLTVLLVVGAGAAIGFDKFASVGDAAAGAQMAADVDSSVLGGVLGTIQGIPIGNYILVFVLFFIFGYLLYSTLFAAVGSAVENEGDSQQLQLPLTIPLMIGYFIAIYTFRSPDSGVAFWGSMIPFTSPIVMLARLPFQVDTWEIILSLVILAATSVFCAWLSARIYKVGILMFGKKSNWKDLLKWLKQN